MTRATTSALLVVALGACGCEQAFSLDGLTGGHPSDAPGADGATDPGVACDYQPPCSSPASASLCCSAPFADGKWHYPDPTSEAYCATDAAACSAWHVWGCDDAADCASQPGTICCATLDPFPPNQAYLDSSCVLPRDCDASSRTLCDPHDPTGCPSGQTCATADAFLPELYSYCK